jgi:hypothetical protein
MVLDKVSDRVNEHGDHPTGEGDLNDQTRQDQKPTEQPKGNTVTGRDLFPQLRGMLTCFGKDHGIGCLDAALIIYDHQTITAAITAAFRDQRSQIEADKILDLIAAHVAPPKPKFVMPAMGKPMIDLEVYRTEGRIIPAKESVPADAPPMDAVPPPADADRWRYEQAKPWCQGLKPAGAKIGPNNWTVWKALTETHGTATVVAAVRGLDPEDRWPDKTEKHLTPSRGQVGSLKDQVAHKVIRLTL